MDHLGFGIKEYPQFDVGNMLYFTNHDSQENDVLLLGHLDTWYANQDFTPFYKTGNKLYGSGIAESKGGLISMISALRALRFARILRKDKMRHLCLSAMTVWVDVSVSSWCTILAKCQNTYLS